MLKREVLNKYKLSGKKFSFAISIYKILSYDIQKFYYRIIKELLKCEDLTNEEKEFLQCIKMEIKHELGLK